MTKRTLKGIGWDHPRGFACLKETVPAFEADHPDITVEWEARSLRDFGEAPVEPLADRYDFIIVDHPFVGTAHATGCLLDLNDIVPDLVKATLEDEVGNSARSYHFAGAVYGLPTDAAAQVAAYRPDLLERAGFDVPRTHNDVLALAVGLREQGMWMAVPACPTDSICLVMTYATNLGEAPAGAEGVFLETGVLRDVMDLVRELVSLAHTDSTARNPIKTLDAMAEGDEIAYVPLAFGYSNYARNGVDRMVLAADFAGPGEDPAAGALLGGAGCSVTRSCKDLDAAAVYLTWLHQKEVMRGPYFEEGGQPGSRAAWEDSAVNAASNNFFKDTLQTLDKAYLRPRFHGYVPFFEAAGETMNSFLKGETTRNEAAAAILDGYARAFDEAPTHG
ncbi:MAG: ABC transporter substrate-binding protein [Devosia sp.]